MILTKISDSSDKNNFLFCIPKEHGHYTCLSYSNSHIAHSIFPISMKQFSWNDLHTAIHTSIQMGNVNYSPLGFQDVGPKTDLQ